MRSLCTRVATAFCLVSSSLAQAGIGGIPQVCEVRVTGQTPTAIMALELYAKRFAVNDAKGIYAIERADRGRTEGCRQDHYDRLETLNDELDQAEQELQAAKSAQEPSSALNNIVIGRETMESIRDTAEESRRAKGGLTVEGAEARIAELNKAMETERIGAETCTGRKYADIKRKREEAYQEALARAKAAFPEMKDSDWSMANFAAGSFFSEKEKCGYYDSELPGIPVNSRAWAQAKKDFAAERERISVAYKKAEDAQKKIAAWEIENGTYHEPKKPKPKMSATDWTALGKSVTQTIQNDPYDANCDASTRDCPKGFSDDTRRMLNYQLFMSTQYEVESPGAAAGK